MQFEKLNNNNLSSTTTSPNLSNFETFSSKNSSLIDKLSDLSSLSDNIKTDKSVLPFGISSIFANNNNNAFINGENLRQI